MSVDMMRGRAVAAKYLRGCEAHIISEMVIAGPKRCSTLSKWSGQGGIRKLT